MYTEIELLEMIIEYGSITIQLEFARDYKLFTKYTLFELPPYSIYKSYYQIGHRIYSQKVPDFPLLFGINQIILNNELT